MQAKPKFLVSRDGNEITVTFLNRETMEAEVFMSRFHGEAMKLIDTTDEDTFTFSVNPDWNATVLARYMWEVLGLVITEDHTDQEPPYYTVEMPDGGDFVYSTQSYNPSWSDPVEYETIDVSSTLEKGTKSNRQYTKRL